MRGGWSRNSALVGVLGWTAVCACAGAGKAPLGVIELLFLFAILVIVPLGWVLGEGIAPISSRPLRSLAKAQPFAAAAVTASFWISPGSRAGMLALPWALLCLSIALVGALSPRSTRSLADFAVHMGRMDLAVAAVWLLASRLGPHPMIFQEPIVLLTEIHFHYTGFASATILAAAVKASTKSQSLCPLRWFAVLVLFTPLVLAVGFVYSPLLKMFAGIAMVVAMSGLAVASTHSRRFRLLSGESSLFKCFFRDAGGGNGRGGNLRDRRLAAPGLAGDSAGSPDLRRSSTRWDFVVRNTWLANRTRPTFLRIYFRCVRLMGKNADKAAYSAKFSCCNSSNESMPDGRF